MFSSRNENTTKSFSHSNNFHLTINTMFLDINTKELYVEETDKWREYTVNVNVYIDDSGYIYLMSYLCDIYIFSSALKDFKTEFLSLTQPKTSVCDYSAQTFSLIQSQLPVRPDSSLEGFLFTSFLNVFSQVKFNRSDCNVVAENKAERWSWRNFYVLSTIV